MTEDKRRWERRYSQTRSGNWALMLSRKRLAYIIRSGSDRVGYVWTVTIDGKDEKPKTLAGALAPKPTR